LAIDRNLEAGDIKTLGLFRQAYQKLREAIRDGMPMKWTHDTPEYTLFNKLAVGTSCIIFSPEKEKKQVNSDAATKALFQITEIRSEDWEKERDRIAKELKHKGES
jgi:hypothetical protein